MGAGIALAAAIGLLFGHPYLLALPDRVAEWRFLHRLHVGISESEAIALAHRTGNSGAYGTVHADKRHVYLLYPHWETVCMSWGTEYTLFFDKAGRVQRWTHRRFDSYC